MTRIAGVARKDHIFTPPRSFRFDENGEWREDRSQFTTAGFMIMPWFDSTDRYGTVSRVLHWLMALLVLVMFATGWGREFLPDAWGRTIMLIHKSTGVSILGLVVLRVLWRLFNKGPTLSGSVSRVLGLAAKAVHLLLYAMMLGMPVIGWALSSAAGRPVVFLGLFPLPSLVGPNKPLAHTLEEFHEAGALIFAALVAVHIAAALWHGIVLKDGVLNRMLPAKKERPAP